MRSVEFREISSPMNPAKNNWLPIIIASIAKKNNGIRLSRFSYKYVGAKTQSAFFISGVAKDRESL